MNNKLIKAEVKIKMNTIAKFFRQQKILWLTMLILVGTCIVCHALPKTADINWETIFSLFSLMLVTQYLIKINVLDYLSQKIIDLANTHRQVTQLLVLLAGFLAMFLTNDVAILSLVPLFLAIHHQVHGPFILPLSLITISANLGSALTPFGNPQNLYLYNHYHLTLGNFFKLSLPLALISLILLVAATMTIPKTTLPKLAQTKYVLQPIQLTAAIILLALAFAGVLHFVKLTTSAIAIFIIILLLDRSTIKRIDYGTLLTFIGFFLIVGILGRQVTVIRLISHFLHQGTQITYWTGIILSQVISNVPATLLIANFSTNIAAIFFGVNVGGLGTPIASFANLLALKQAQVHDWKIVAGFLFINFSFLIVLALLTLIILK